MNNQQRSQVEQTLFGEFAAMRALLKAIYDEMVKLNDAQAPLNPNYRRRLSEFGSFDWSSIGADIKSTDAQGVVEVEWHGHRFDRATGESYNKKFIIFSRPAPDWSQQNKKYYTLIKFADYNDAPLIQQPAHPPSQSTTQRTIQPLDYQQTNKPPNYQTSQPSNQQTTQPPNQLSITTAAEFYKLVNQHTKHPGIHQIVGELANQPTNWQEKANALLERVTA